MTVYDLTGSSQGMTDSEPEEVGSPSLISANILNTLNTVDLLWKPSVDLLG
jgi:hypothetical protein